MMDVTLKTAVNTRASLFERTASLFPGVGGGADCCTNNTSAATAAATLTSTTRPYNRYASTYTNDYDAHASLRLARNASAPHKPTATMVGAAATGASSSAAAATQGQREQQQQQLPLLPSQSTTTTTAAAAAGSYRVVAEPSSSWQSQSHAAARALQPDVCLDFYSNARKIERVDDDRRGGLVGNVQRTVDILRRRAHDDPRLRVPSPTFVRTQRARPPAHAARERGAGAPLNYLDLVSCTHTLPPSEEQLSYDTAAAARLPPTGTLSPSWRVQSKAVTLLSTTRELQRGTVKHLDEAHHYAPHYTGHIPVAEHNLQQLRSSDTAAAGDVRRVYAKSYMTLAVHGGGVDASVTGNSIAARHRGGKNARAPQMLKPRKEHDVGRTVEGSMLQRTLHETLPSERALNTRVHVAPHSA